MTDRSFSENNQRIVEKLKTWGMTEYESKIYTSLVMLQVGSARDIHELTDIPRGRVYEILGDLTKKGYIGIIQGSPTRYRALDISRTFERIKKDTMGSIDEIRQMLEEIEKTAKPANVPGYVVQSESAIDNQVNAILKQARDAVLVLCNDPAFLKKYKQEIKYTHTKLDLRVVVEDPADYPDMGLKLYRCDPLMKKSLMDEKIFGDYPARILFAIFADYREDVIIIRRGSSLEGLFSSEFVITEYLQRSMMERTEKA
ncbi:TrmB family transcriptional regulator [Methanofollis ethanolicus]|uniref:TrmB family transcriptional regulator n=1 Tax=Methanofollis ethanolicus TaxID=488124 RepID=UPI00228735B9|nr:helix-turn-helix domain-containing protein [Methanofollis ethanolicus]